MRKLAVLFLGVWLISNGNADSWRLPERAQIPSSNGTYVLDLVPSNLQSPIEYFRDKETGRKSERNPCWARLLRKLAGGKEEVVWTADLDNNVSPVSVLVADSGRVVVCFDNWHEVGYGPNVMAVYGEDGKLRFRHSLEELMAADQINKLSPSTSSRHWRRGRWLDEEADQVILATEPGPLVVVNLHTGAVQPGGTPEIRAALKKLSGPQVALPLELAEEQKLQAVEDYRRLFQDSKQPVPVRLGAAVSLRRCGDRSGERLLVEKASRGEGSSDRAYALTHLAEFLDLRAVPILQQAMRSGDSTIWNGAMSGLAKLGPRVGPILMAMLATKEKADFRGGAAYVLRDLKYLPARRALLDTLADRDEYVASACFQSLRAMGIPKEFQQQFLVYLIRGTKVDAQLAGYFCKHRNPRAPAALLKALQRRHYAKRTGYEEEVLVTALEFQTGVHLGQDTRAWQQFLKAGPTRQERAEALLRLGDSDGWLLLDLPNNRDRLARALTTHLRLMDQRSGPNRCGQASLDPNGAAVVMPYPEGRYALLKLPELTEKMVTVPDVYEHNIAFSQNGEWVALPGGNGLEVYSVVTGLRRGEAISRDLDSAEHTDVANDGSRVLESGNEARIWGIERKPSQLQIPGTDWGGSTLSPDGRILALHKERGATLIDLDSSESVELNSKKLPEILSSRFVSYSTTLATWGRDGELDLWDLGGHLLHSYPVKGGGSGHWSVSSNGFLLGLDGGLVLAWNGISLSRWKADHQPNLSGHGDYALTGGNDNWLRIWKPSTAKAVARLPVRRDDESLHTHAAITPDGRHLVTLGSDRNLVRLWRLPGQDAPDTDVPLELLQQQLKRATGRQLKNGKIQDLTQPEYQSVVQRCQQMESAHQATCSLRREHQGH